jgi:hypothetical protein
MQEPIRQIRLYCGKYPQEYGIDLEVTVFSDGGWRKSAEPGYSSGAFVINLLKKPKETVQVIDLDGQEIRSLKIVQVGSDQQAHWSVAELKIFKSP